MVPTIAEKGVKEYILSFTTCRFNRLKECAVKSFRLIAIVSFLSFSLMAANAQSRLHFEASGFSIMPLEAVSDDVPYQPMTMYLPPTDGFAPNVNVQIQPYDGDLDDYIALSQQQFEEYGLRIVDEKRSDTEIAWEYTGSMQERELHWYARAIHTEGKMYLVTAAATETQWTSVSAGLKSCVDSFTTKVRK